MKVYISIIAGVVSAMMAACTDSDYTLDKLVPQEYHKVFYMKPSGTQSITLYDTANDNEYGFSVIKAGSDPTLKGNLKIDVLSEEALKADYSVPEGKNYQLLPSNSYSISLSDVSFESAEEYKDIKVVISPSLVKSAITAGDSDAVYVLPMRLTSAAGDSVNSEMNMLFLTIAGVVTPSIGFTTAEGKAEIYQYGSVPAKITPQIELGLSTTNTWDLTATLAADESYVDTYNAKNESYCTILPSSAYSLEQTVTLNSGTTTAAVGLTINTAGLSPGSHILPIKIASVSQFNIDEDNSVYPYVFDIMAPRLDRAAWTVTATSQEAGGEGPKSGYATAIIDGDNSTFWHSRWNGGTDPLPHDLTFDTNAEKTYYQFGLTRRSGNNYVKGGEIAVSEDGTNWTKVCDFTMAAVDDEQIFNCTPTKGRYIRMRITKTTNSTHACMAEFNAFGM